MFRDILGNSWVFDGRKYLFPIFTSLNIALYGVFTNMHEFRDICIGIYCGFVG